MDLQIPPLNFNGIRPSSSGPNSATSMASPRKLKEAKHDVLLFFVELLMEHKSRKLHDLSCLFGSPNFSPQMKQVVGGSQVGLKRFLLKYPSLFTIKGDTVTMTCYDIDDLFRNGQESTVSITSPRENTRLSPEEEAVEFFRSKLLAATEYRLPLRSLVGHRSQAPERIRSVMGKNLPDFIRFIRSNKNMFIYDEVRDVVQLTLTGQTQQSVPDCLSPNSSSSSRSVSLVSGEFDVNECLDFLASILQQRGPLFLDELYGHLNKRYKPDIRQHFAKNPRELGEMIQQKASSRFRVEGNLVSYHGQLSPQDGPGNVKSPPGSAREGMKLKLAQTLSKVMTENKARGSLPEPEMEKGFVAPWNEITKPKQLKSLVSEIMDVSAGTEAIGMAFILEKCAPQENQTSQLDNMNENMSNIAEKRPEIGFKLSKIFVSTFDGKVHLIPIQQYPDLVKLGGLRELLISDKIRKVFHDGSRGLAALVAHYGLRVVNPFDTQIGYSILEHNQNVDHDSDPFLTANRSISIMDIANSCLQGASRSFAIPNKLDSNEVVLFEAYRDLRLVFPAIYEALKSRIPLKQLPLMRHLLEEEYEEYLNPERAKLLKKNRLALHHHEQTGNFNGLHDFVPNGETSFTQNGHEETNGGSIHDHTDAKKVTTSDASCQTTITGDIQSLHGLIYDEILQMIRKEILLNGSIHE